MNRVRNTPHACSARTMGAMPIMFAMPLTLSVVVLAVALGSCSGTVVESQKPCSVPIIVAKLKRFGAPTLGVGPAPRYTPPIIKCAMQPTSLLAELQRDHPDDASVLTRTRERWDIIVNMPLVITEWAGPRGEELRRVLHDNPTSAAARPVLESLFAEHGLRREEETTSQISRWHDTVDTAKQFTSRHFAPQLLLSRIATAAETSVFHLCRIFRRLEGVTVHHHLVRLRLRFAFVLSFNADMSLAEVALAFAFCSQEHMTMAFRRKCGTRACGVRRSFNGKRLAAAFLFFNGEEPLAVMYPFDK